MVALCFVEYTDAFRRTWSTKIGWHRGADGEWYGTPGYAQIDEHDGSASSAAADDPSLPGPASEEEEVHGNMNDNSDTKNDSNAQQGSIGQKKDEGQEHAGTSNQEHANSKAEFWKRLGAIKMGALVSRTYKGLTTFERVSAAIQMVSAVAIVLYSGFSCYQWNEMRRFNDITELSFKQGARARFDPESFVSVGKELHKEFLIQPSR
jgi:hypothetical protein